MIPCYFVTDAVTCNELPATIRPATQRDFEKTVLEHWQTGWLTDHIQQDELEKYLKLDEAAAPNSYVAIPSEEDLAYIAHFRQVCKRYQIDFAQADEDERDSVIRMAEKSFAQKRA